MSTYGNSICYYYLKIRNWLLKCSVSRDICLDDLMDYIIFMYICGIIGFLSYTILLNLHGMRLACCLLISIFFCVCFFLWNVCCIQVHAFLLVLDNYFYCQFFFLNKRFYLVQVFLSSFFYHNNEDPPPPHTHTEKKNNTHTHTQPHPRCDLNLFLDPGGCLVQFGNPVFYGMSFIKLGQCRQQLS